MIENLKELGLVNLERMDKAEKELYGESDLLKSLNMFIKNRVHELEKRIKLKSTQDKSCYNQLVEVLKENDMRLTRSQFVHMLTCCNMGVSLMIKTEGELSHWLKHDFPEKALHKIALETCWRKKNEKGVE